MCSRSAARNILLHRHSHILIFTSCIQAFDKSSSSDEDTRIPLGKREVLSDEEKLPEHVRCLNCPVLSHRVFVLWCALIGYIEAMCTAVSVSLWLFADQSLLYPNQVITSSCIENAFL